MKAITQTRAGILYRGPSRIDGAPIVVIGVWPAGSVTNAKTGRMVQTFILRADQSPIEAIQSAADSSICGSCRHRDPAGGFANRSCYVNIGQAPTSVYRAFIRGSYPVLSAAKIRELGTGRMVRLGTYGDPAAAPAEVWRDLVSGAIGHTGYTHQWRAEFSLDLRALCMASVDSARELEDARAAGWRTFRVRTESEALAPLEFACPASAEAGKKVLCIECKACNGSTGRKGSPAIIAHGAFARRFALNQSRV